MKELLTISVLTVLALCQYTTTLGQTPQPSPAATQATDAGITPNGVIGEVVLIEAPAKRMTVKTDAGNSLIVMLDEKSVYMRLAPGEKTLKNAVKIGLADVGVGDRVWARGKVSEDHKSVPALALLVMTKADIAQKQEHDRAEWRRRGISGLITALDPETKEITLSPRGQRGDAQQPIIITTAGSVTFRRYAPDSVKFNDARPSSFAELKVGDQLRALGEKSADGARFTPEEIVSGSFRTIGGEVTATNPATNEIQIKDIQSGKPLAVLISKDTLLRRIPPEFAARMAQRGQREGERGEANASSRPPDAQPSQGRGDRRGGVGEGGAQFGGGGPRMGRGVDFQEMLERFPTITLAELKPGDMIIVSSTKGAEASRVTAIALVAGVDALLNRMQERQRSQERRGEGAGLDGLGGPIDFGIGLP
jgi:hypothetical protein